LKFLVDAQLPPALARWLTSQGHQAAHVADLGLGAAPDQEIWKKAAESGAVLLTKDEDFATLSLLRQTKPTVVWIRLGNTRRGALLQWFEHMLPTVLAALDRGEFLIELN